MTNDMLKELKSIKGQGTEMISVYIPSSMKITKGINHLRDEYKKSKNMNVLSAIDKILQYLKNYKETPSNGLAVFCGNISTNQEKINIELFSIEPPFPLKESIYLCDSKFFLEPLADMI